MNNENFYNIEKDKLKLILNSFSDAILLESKDRIVEFVNEGFCNLFKIKLPPESVLGSNCEEGVIGASFQFKNPSRFIYRIEELIEDRIPVKGEPLNLRDGRLFYRDYNPIVLNGQILGHLWIYKEDPQQLHLAFEQKQQLEQLLYQDILVNIPIDIFILNVQKQYIFVNKHTLPDERKRKFIIGKTDAEYHKYYSINNDKADVKEVYFDKALNDGQVNHFELKANDLMGNECYKRTTLYPIVDENGVVDKIVAYSIDISVEKEAENRFNEIIKQYIHALNAVNDVVFVANEKLEVSFLNDAFNNHFLEDGIELGNIFKYIPFQKPDFYKDIFSVLSEEEDNKGGRISLQNKNNTQSWYKYNIRKGVSTNENKQSGIVTVLNDITGEVILEENLLEVVKREKELNELKSAFVNMVSHEMRTPLAIISSCAEIIQMMLASGKPTSDIESYTNHILSEVERMTTFMNDILMISKIEAGKIEFNPEEISLISFVNELIKKSYSPWKDDRSLNLVVKGYERIFPFDVKMLRHILQNLIENSFKYSPNKQAPTLRLRYSNSYITFSVIDNGIGIHPEDIEKLFSSFARGRNVGSISGTGIGLVVVKYFVDQHKGSIRIKSKLDVGTIFSIKIPY